MEKNFKESFNYLENLSWLDSLLLWAYQLINWIFSIISITYYILPIGLVLMAFVIFTFISFSVFLISKS